MDAIERIDDQACMRINDQLEILAVDNIVICAGQDPLPIIMD